MPLLGVFVMNPPMSACSRPYFNLQFTEEETETQGRKVTVVSLAGAPGGLLSWAQYSKSHVPGAPWSLANWDGEPVSFTHRCGMHLPPVCLLLTPAPVTLQQTAEPLGLPCVPAELQVLGAATSLPGALSQ